MAAKKSNQPSRRQRRRMRFQQILFGLLAFVIIAAFIVSLVA
jgi:hypothetical protein